MKSAEKPKLADDYLFQRNNSSKTIINNSETRSKLFSSTSGKNSFANTWTTNSKGTHYTNDEKKWAQEDLTIDERSEKKKLSSYLQKMNTLVNNLKIFNQTQFEKDERIFGIDMKDYPKIKKTFEEQLNQLSEIVSQIHFMTCQTPILSVSNFFKEKSI